MRGVTILGKLLTEDEHKHIAIVQCYLERRFSEVASDHRAVIAACSPYLYVLTHLLVVVVALALQVYECSEASFFVLGYARKTHECLFDGSYQM